MTDVETGYKAFRGDIIRNMRIGSSGFGFEIEATAKVAKLGCAIYEVPISYYGRTYDEGKKVGFADGLKAIWYVIRFNLFCTLRASFRQLPERNFTRASPALRASIKVKKPEFCCFKKSSDENAILASERRFARPRPSRADTLGRLADGNPQTPALNRLSR